MRIRGNAGILGHVDLEITFSEEPPLNLEDVLSRALPAPLPVAEVPANRAVGTSEGWKDKQDLIRDLLGADVTVTGESLPSPVSGPFLGVAPGRDLEFLVALPYGEPLRLVAGDWSLVDVVVDNGWPLTVHSIRGPIMQAQGKAGEPPGPPVPSWVIRRTVRDTRTWAAEPTEPRGPTPLTAPGELLQERANAQVATASSMPSSLVDFLETWPLLPPEADPDAEGSLNPREEAISRLVLDRPAVRWCKENGGLLNAAQLVYANLDGKLADIVAAALPEGADPTYPAQVAQSWAPRRAKDHPLGQPDPARVTIRMCFEAALAASAAVPGEREAVYGLRGEHPPPPK